MGGQPRASTASGLTWCSGCVQPGPGSCPAFCNICGRHAGHSGVWVTIGFYAGSYQCAVVAVAAKEVDGIRRALEFCCRPAHMPGMLKVFTTHPDLNLALSRLLKFGRYEKVCAFRRFLLPRLQMPARVSDAILNYLIPL